MKNTVAIALLLLFSVILTGCSEESYLEQQESKEVTEEADVTNVPDAAGGTKADTETSFIYVQIEGAVVSPGVYRLPADSRVFALIEAAGGLTEKASTSDINQAAALSDGQKVTVLTKKQAREAAKAGGTSQPDTAAKVDINTADVSQLTTVSGIGPSRAEAIIAYRNENGPFRQIEDITNVSGIGNATFEKIKDSITV